MYSILFLTFNFLIQINFNILAWIWKITHRLYIMIRALILNIILNYFLIKYMWVVWRALATWIIWIFIWILSEIILKEYYTKFEYFYLLKNILLLSFVWVIFYYLMPFTLLETSRFKSFFIFLFISILYFSIYIIINIKDFKYFIWEVKKLKKK